MVMRIILVMIMTVIFAAPVHAAEIQGDGIEPVINTERNEENSCQVNIEADMPEGFNLDLFVDFSNDETGTLYRLYALNKNDYKAYIFVPAGTYSIIECSIYGDTVNRYPLNIPDGFTLSENDIYTITTYLINEDTIKEEIEEKVIEKTEIKPEVKNKPAALEKETEDLPVYEDSKPLPWRTIKKSDGLEADVTVTGLSKGKYDILIKIVKTGEVNEAEFVYSLDGGNSWSTNELLKSSFSPEKTGLSFKFPSNDTRGLSDTWKAVYKEGDTIEFHSYPEASITSTVSKGAVINAYLTDTVRSDYQVEIKIMRTGSIGTALFGYSLDGGNTYTGTNLPVSEVFNLKELPVVIEFTDLAGEYVVNDTFSFDIKGVKEVKDTTYLLYLLGFLVALAALSFYIYLTTLKEKDSTYRLNVYVPYNIHKSR